MFRFYLKFGWLTLKLMWSSVAHIEGAIAVVMFVLLLFNKELGSKVLDWDGIEPIWCLVPIALFFVFALLKVNYQEFQKVEKAKNESDARLKELQEESGQPDIEQNRRLLYAAAIDILTNLMQERFRKHQVLLTYFWAGGFPDWTNVLYRLTEWSRSTGKYKALIEPSLFHSDDTGKMKAALKVINGYIWEPSGHKVEVLPAVTIEI